MTVSFECFAEDGNSTLAPRASVEQLNMLPRPEPGSLLEEHRTGCISNTTHFERGQGICRVLLLLSRCSLQGVTAKIATVGCAVNVLNASIAPEL